MKKNFLLRIATNKHRYYFAGALFISTLIGVLSVAALTNNQLLVKEQHSAVESATFLLVDLPKSLVDAPYHIAQKISLHFFDVTTFGIKLPSLIIAIFIGVGFAYLLRYWILRPSIALFTSIIAITNVHFLYAATTGTPMIMLMFWPMSLFLVGLKLVRSKGHFIWGFLLSILVGLSLYTPLMIYVFVSILILAILHPHLRYLIKKISKIHLLIYFLTTIMIVAPLGYSLLQNPSDMLVLLGKPEAPLTFKMLGDNFLDLSRALVQFWYPTFTYLGPQPMFSVASLVLVLFGVMRLLSQHYSARSYGLLILMPITIILSIINPSLMTVIFVPGVLLLAIGISAFLYEWNKIFPFNPYARVVALVPFFILLTSIMVTNIVAFQNTYRYNPVIEHYYTRDLALIRPLLDRYPEANIVTSAGSQPFYDLLRRDYPKISTSTSKIKSVKDHPVIAGVGSDIKPDQDTIPSFLVTDYYAHREPRFYVYTK